MPLTLLTSTLQKMRAPVTSQSDEVISLSFETLSRYTAVGASKLEVLPEDASLLQASSALGCFWESLALMFKRPLRARCPVAKEGAFSHLIVSTLLQYVWVKGPNCTILWRARYGLDRGTSSYSFVAL